MGSANSGPQHLPSTAGVKTMSNNQRRHESYYAPADAPKARATCKTAMIDKGIVRPVVRKTTDHCACCENIDCHNIMRMKKDYDFVQEVTYSNDQDFLTFGVPRTNYLMRNH